jgi:hypothetical protein
VDILTIVRTLARFRLSALALVATVAGGCALALLAVPPVYEASGSYAVSFPAAAPTRAQIEEDPSLATVRADNPYLRFRDSSVIIDVVVRRLDQESYRQVLAGRGADPRYVVRQSDRFGTSGPIIDISAPGATPDLASDTVEIVGQALIEEFDAVQADDVDAPYRFGLLPVAAPADVFERPYGRTRALAGVLALGGLALVVMVASLRRVSGAGARQS